MVVHANKDDHDEDDVSSPPFRNNVVVPRTDENTKQQQQQQQEEEEDDDDDAGNSPASREARLLGVISRLPQVVEVFAVDPRGLAAAAAAEEGQEGQEGTAAEGATASSAATAAASSPADTGLLYLVHDFASSPSWGFDTHYDALPRDPYVRDIGVGRFREYSKFRYVFSPPRGVANVANVFFQASPGSPPGSTPGPSESQHQRDFYAPVNVDAAEGGDALLEIPDPKFNQPAGYVFTGRQDNKSSATAAADRCFSRVSPAMAALPEFAEIIRRFAAHARLDPRYARRTHLDLGGGGERHVSICSFIFLSIISVFHLHVTLEP